MNLEAKEMVEKCFQKKAKFTIYKNTLLLERYLSVADVIENFEVREDDIWLCGFPKSGTTWAEEMIWNIANDLNFEAAKSSILERFPYFEHSAMFNIKPPLPAYFEDSIEYVKNLPRRRFIKTHLPFHLLPRQLRTNEKKAKLIYIWRNPKDVCISQYYFFTWMNWYSGNITDYCKLFLNDGALYMPYWNHIIEFWNRRQEENILFLRYEDLKADLRSEIRRSANFLGKKSDLKAGEAFELCKHEHESSSKSRRGGSGTDG